MSDSSGAGMTEAQVAYARAQGIQQMADRIAALEAENANLRATDQHSCHDDCPRPACVLGRRVRELEAEVARYKEWPRCASGHEMGLLAECPQCRLEAECERLRVRGATSHVGFYEKEFYPLSNFSAFTLLWKGLRFDTSEAAYHWEKFPDRADIRFAILHAPSAHEAFKMAEACRKFRRPDWDEVKVSIMKEVLVAKVAQHEYVRRKLLETGDGELIEDSWRDDYWGWGPNQDGQNMLGKLWMEVRQALRDEGGTE